MAQAGIGQSEFKAGQTVIAPGRTGSWCEAFVADAKSLVPVPPGIPVEIAAMSSVNLPTAYRMMQDFVTLKPGDWIVQNAANSAVGRFVIQLAKFKGIKTANLVRSEEAAEELRALGATFVALEGDDPAKKIKAHVDGAPVMLGLNAVGGESAQRVAKVLSPKATLVTYGAMSREPFIMGNGVLIFKDVRMRGFWINKWYDESTPKVIRRMFSELFPLLKSESFSVPIERRMRLEEAVTAVALASRGGRKGKIIFEMN